MSHPPHRFDGSPEFLRRPERLAVLEVDRAVTLALEGLTGARTVLDMGTGSGVFAEAFARRGLRAVGLDLRHGMLLAAREACPEAAWVQADMEQPPFPSGAFDLVFFGVALHEAGDLEGLLRQARRLARRRVAALEWPKEPQPLGPPLHHRLSPAQVTAARRVGFAQVETLRLTHLVLYRLG